MMRVLIILFYFVSSTLGLDERIFQFAKANSIKELRAIEKELQVEREIEKEHYKAAKRKLATEDELYGDSLPLTALPKYGKSGFYHGVASGSPTEDSVVLWTRYTPYSESDIVDIELRVAKVDANINFDDHLDPSKNIQMRRIAVRVVPEHDWVAKIDVQGLEAGTSYVFAFVVAGTALASDVGQTKTAPAAGSDASVPLRVAVFSCADFTYGYFHAYDIASRVQDLDMWIHVGDYTYEYGGYASRASQERNANLEPYWEPVSLIDYRLRFGVYHDDEGLRNIRRRAPMMIVWDDHESTNNPYYWNGVDGTGADNHQPECSANYRDSDSELSSAGCSLNEGDWHVRVNNAAKAFYEWMPIRSGNYFAGMGQIENYDLTQVVSWGDLATFVALDTRHTARSREPTLNSFVFGQYLFTYNEDYSDTSEYGVAGTDANDLVLESFDAAVAEASNPDYKMISQGQLDVLESEFSKSKNAGQPWQVFLSSVQMAPIVVGDWSAAADQVPDSDAYYDYWNETLKAAGSGFFRQVYASSLLNTPWNPDGWDGFTVQRNEVLEMFQSSANNPVVLSGDVHDFWSSILYEGGTVEEGVPVATNHVAGGVTRTGWGPFLASAFASAIDGTLKEGYDLQEATFIASNPGLKYQGGKDPGFFVMEMNSTHMITEYIMANPEGIDANFDKNTVSLYSFSLARHLFGDITMPYYCDKSLVTDADTPGSLSPQDSCQIPFDDARPAVWDLSVPAAVGCTTNDDCTDSGFVCDLPSPIECDNVFNCPSNAADASTSRRRLRFGFHSGDDEAINADSLGACVPSS